MATNIKAIIFDIGGVLVSSPVLNLRSYSVELGLGQHEIGVALGRSAAFKKLEKGKLSDDDFCKDVEKELNDKGYRVSGTELFKRINSSGLHRDLLHAIKVIKKDHPGIKTAIITNNFLSKGMIKLRQVLSPLFDVFIESFEVGMRKPDPAIYELCCEKLAVQPSECIFLDDLGQNLKSAKQLGIHTILVKNNDTTKAIKDLGSALQWDVSRALYPVGVSRTGISERNKIDINSLTTYLKAQVPSLFPEKEQIINIQYFSAGRSNPTYYFRLLHSGKELVLRKQPTGDLLKGAHDMTREYNLLSLLGRYTDIPVPKVYTLCQDKAVIGTHWYLMDFVPGRLWKGGQAFKEAPHYHFVDAYNHAIQTLAELHLVPFEKVWIFPEAVKANSGDKLNNCYFERTIRIWLKQYNGGLKQGAPRIENLEKLADQLSVTLKEVTFDTKKRSLIHGDYKLDNMIFNEVEPKVAALLDFELSTIGHPYADLGYFVMWHRLPIMVNGMGNPSHIKENDIISRYCEKTGHKALSRFDLEFLVAFSMFKLSCIAHGVWSRSLRGTASVMGSKAETNQIGAQVKVLASQGLSALKAGKSSKSKL